MSQLDAAVQLKRERKEERCSYSVELIMLKKLAL